MPAMKHQTTKMVREAVSRFEFGAWHQLLSGWNRYFRALAGSAVPAVSLADDGN
jgi:hypothetical protein